MGIAYATLAGSMGYRVRLVIPENASPERLAILRSLGAEFTFRRRSKAPTVPSARRGPSPPRTRMNTSTPTSTTTRPTGRRTTPAPGPKSSSRPAAR